MTYSYVPPPKLERLTPESIASVPDDRLESALLTYVLEEFGRTKDRFGALARLPEALQVWYLGYLVHLEVMNGGFNQYFFNSSGQFAEITPAAFERMGMPGAAALLGRALDLLETYAPALEEAQDRGTVEAFAETYDEQPFSELDAEYSVNEEQWRKDRIAFIRRSAAEMQHPG